MKVVVAANQWARAWETQSGAFPVDQGEGSVRVDGARARRIVDLCGQLWGEGRQGCDQPTHSFERRQGCAQPTQPFLGSAFFVGAKGRVRRDEVALRLERVVVFQLWLELAALVSSPCARRRLTASSVLWASPAVDPVGTWRRPASGARGSRQETQGLKEWAASGVADWPGR